MIQLLSINVARAETLEVGGKSVTTGLLKQPREGIASITQTGITGDFIANAAVHGGPDQALYLYSQVDSDWWGQKLGRQLMPGFFGENLTLSQWWPDVRIGDRIRFAEVELEISFPRIPCATFASRVDGAKFLKDFLTAGRPGFYARVITPGELTAPSRGELIPADTSNPDGLALYELWHRKNKDVALIQAALHAPISVHGRETLMHWLNED